MKKMDKEKPIVFTQLRGPSMWQYKVALSLRKKNYKTAIFLPLRIKDFDQNSCRRAFSEIFTLNLKNLKPFSIFKNFILHPFNFLNFFWKLLTIKPYVLIAEGAPHYLAAFFIWFFKGRCKRIYFPYDMNFSRLRNPEKIIPKYELKGEEYAFKNCDALVYKNGEGELNLLPKEFNVFSKLHYNFPCYVLSEWNQPYNKNKKLSFKDKEIHIVYIGDLDITPRVGAPTKNVVKDIINQGIHLHIYPTRTIIPESHLKEIAPTEKLRKLLHIHKYVYPVKLSQEISKYDFGLHPVNYSSNTKPGVEKYAGANKVASYFEAAIPPILKKEVEMYSKLIRKYKIGIAIDKYSNVKNPIKKLNYNQMIKNIYKFRKQYSVESHIDELISFIESLNN